jgi:hypothetical protein
MSPILKHFLWVLAGTLAIPLLIMFWSTLKYALVGIGAILIVGAVVLVCCFGSYLRSLDQNDEEVELDRSTALTDRQSAESAQAR